MNTLKPPATRESFYGPPEAPARLVPSASEVPEAYLPLSQSFRGLGLTAWLVVVLAIGVALFGREAAALPLPVGAEALSNGMATLRDPADAGRWMAVHVVYSGSRASQPIVDRLLLADRPGDFAETVILVGADADLQAHLAARGMHVQTTDAATLGKRFGIAAAPLLVVVAPDGTVRYAGGYAEAGDEANPQDLEIMSDTLSGVPRSPLPITGSPMSARLRSAVVGPRLF